MALRIKRGTNAERLAYTPELGEPIYVTDYSSAGVAPVFIGDGSTSGGVAVQGTGGGSGGLADIVNDTTPQLGGNLDLNSYDITGTGDINITGGINATLSLDVNLNGSFGGNVSATTMTANTFTGNIDGDIEGSVYGDDSTIIIDGQNNRVIASTWFGASHAMVDTSSNSLKSKQLDLEDATNPQIIINGAVSGGSGHDIIASSSRGTLAVPAVSQAGDGALDITARGYDGDSFENTAVIKLGPDKYTSAIADGIMPGRIVFLTYNESGATGTDNAMVFNRFGYLGIKTDAPAKALDVRGSGVFTGSLTAASMQGTFVADDSTILVDGVAGKVNIAPNNVEDLANVTTSNPQAGQVLKYNGSAWVNDADTVGSGGSGGGIGNIGVGADDSAIRLINSGESFKIIGGTNVTTASDAEGNITVNANIELSNDTSPVLGGDLVTGSNRITFAASGGSAVSHLNFTTTQFGANNTTVLSSVKSINMFLDSNGGDSSCAFRLYNNVDPDSLGSTIEADHIFKVAEDGNTFVKGYLQLNGTVLTGGSDNLSVGSVTSNFIGSVFADDSTLVIDGTNGTIQWARLTSTPTTLAGYGITDAATSAQGTKADSAVQPATLGNFTFTSSVLDSSDSSGITITPAVTMSSDLTVENNLNVTNVITANRFTSTSTDDPEIKANANLKVTAGNAVVITSSPVRFCSFTTTERDALASANGDMVYNSTTNKFQGYANGAWVDLH